MRAHERIASQQIIILAGMLLAGPALADYSVQSLARVLPYQGTLDQDGAPVTAAGLSMTFKLFASQTDCEAATQPAADWAATKTVPVHAGRFAVVLGEAPDPQEVPDSLFRAAEVFLSIQVEAVRLEGCQVIRPVAYAHRSSGDVPIGTVIDWWRPDANVDVPDGYAICDGSVIVEPRSPLDGETTPDLRGKFVRGVSDPTEIGTAGGSDNLPQYTVDPPAQNFTWSTETSGQHTHAWSMFSDAENWWTWQSDGSTTTQLINWDNGLDGDGTGTYPLAKDGTVGFDTDYFTRNSGNHEHTLNASVNLNAFSASADGGNAGKNVPAYVGLLKLIRIY